MTDMRDSAEKDADRIVHLMRHSELLGDLVKLGVTTLDEVEAKCCEHGPMRGWYRHMIELTKIGLATGLYSDAEYWGSPIEQGQALSL
jgi:hypothetical protein